MPRASNGVYTLPNTVNPVVAGTTITDTWANTTLNDIASVLTQCLDRSGRGSMQAPLKLIDGSAAAPALSWGVEATSGIYRPTAGQMAVSIEAVQQVLITSEKVTIAGDLEVAGVAGRIIPVGGIVMWSGSIADIAPGWQLCDGTNGTPDLRDKFVIGARQDDAGVAKTNVTGALTQAGGTKDAVVVAHNHTTAVGNQSVDHRHTGTTDTAGLHNHGVSPNVVGSASSSNAFGTSSGSIDYISAGTTSDGNHAHSFTTGLNDGSHTHVVTVNSNGVSGTNQNLPPYYALAFIQCMAPA